MYIHRFELMTGDSDWSALVTLDKQCYPNEWCVDVQWYHDAYQKGLVSWLMYIERALVGNIQLRKHDSHALYISGVAVLPQYQGLGFGTQLMLKVLNEYGDSDLVARIHENSSRSWELIKPYGFTTTHQQSDEFGLWSWVRRPAAIGKP